MERWTRDEEEKLLDLRDVQRLGWDAVAAGMPGREKDACIVRYYVRKRRDRPLPPYRGRPPKVFDDKPYAPRPIGRKPAPVKIVQAVAIAPSQRVQSLHRLRTDVELRARIEAAGGLTAGMFGDPPPGRSALDKKRAGQS